MASGGIKVPYSGGQISLNYHYLLKEKEVFVERLSEGVYKPDDIIQFNNVSKDAASIDDIPLLYDISSVNAHARWRLSSRESDPYTYFMVHIKPQYKYNPVLHFNNPHVEDYLHAIKLCSSSINILPAFETKPSQMVSAKVLTDKGMNGRNFTDFHMMNGDVNNATYTQWTHTFIERSATTSRREGDPVRCYRQQSLPINHIEAQLYNYGEEIFELGHYSWDEAVRFSYSFELADSVHVSIAAAQSLIDKAIQGTVSLRIPKPQAMHFNRDIYAISRRFMNRANDYIISSIDVSLNATDATEAVLNASAIFGIATVTTNVLANALGDFDPSSLVEVARAMCTVYTNPNIYMVTLTEMGIAPDMNISILFGILTCQALFLSSVVCPYSRLFCNNYLAYYICSFVASNIANQFPDLNADMPLNDWYLNADRMHFLHNHLQAFPDSVVAFVNAYLRVAPRLRPGNFPTSIDTPWASGLESGQFNLCNIHNIVRDDMQNVTTYDYISPILPYPLPEMRNFSGTHLSRMYRLLTDMMMSAPSGAFRGQVAEKYGTVLRGRAPALCAQFDLLYERLYKVATMPFADNELRNPDTQTQRIAVNVSLKRINTNLILLDQNHDDVKIQLPTYNLDFSFQHILPLVSALYTRIRALFGPDARLIRAKELIKQTITILSKAINQNQDFIDKIHNYFTGSDILESFLRVVQMNRLSVFSQRYIERIERTYQWLEMTRYQRGYRSFFYLAVNPLFLNLEVDCTRNAFITNGIPGADKVIILKTYTPAQFLQELNRTQKVDILGHDMRGLITSYYTLKRQMTIKSTAFDKARRAHFHHKVIKVDHPVIVTHHYTELQNSYKKMTHTLFKEGDSNFKNSLINGTPLHIDIDYQVYNGSESLMNSDEYNKYYDHDNVIITSDLLPMDRRFLEVGELYREFNQPLVLREKPREVASLSAEPTITSAARI